MTDYELLIALLFGGVWFVNLLMGFTYGRLVKSIRMAKKVEVDSNNTPPVTVVVTAHNQAHQLRKNLPYILEQEYNGFEVVVMDECSVDETAEVLAEFARKYPHFRYASTPKTAQYISRKKLALTLGIRSTNYDWVILTLADCRPNSKFWLRRMARHFIPGVELVIGYANYRPNKSRFGKLICFDRLYQVADYLYAAAKGRAYRASGCNLAYRKELFERNRGFSNYVNLKYGEDELFVNETATKTNTRVELHPEAFVYQDIPETKKQWQLDKLFYMETRRYLAHKFSTRITYHLRVWSLIIYHLILVGSLCVSLYLRLFDFAIGIGVLHLLQRAIRTWRFNRTASALDEKKHEVLFPNYEVATMLRNANYWIRHKFYRKAFFMKR